MESQNENPLCITKNLKTLMYQKRINLSELSKKVEIPIQTLHNWMNGLSPRNLVQLRRLAYFFELSMDDLCFKELEK